MAGADRLSRPKTIASRQTRHLLVFLSLVSRYGLVQEVMAIVRLTTRLNASSEEVVRVRIKLWGF